MRCRNNVSQSQAGVDLGWDTRRQDFIERLLFYISRFNSLLESLSLFFRSNRHAQTGSNARLVTDKILYVRLRCSLRKLRVPLGEPDQLQGGCRRQSADMTPPSQPHFLVQYNGVFSTMWLRLDHVLKK